MAWAFACRDRDVYKRQVEAMHYIKQRRVKTVQFCKKTLGADSRFVVDFEGGGQYDAPLTKSDYGRGLFRGLFLRPACYHCPYCSTNRAADLTLGTFRGLPADFRPNQQKKGISMPVSYTHLAALGLILEAALSIELLLTGSENELLATFFAN